MNQQDYELAKWFIDNGISKSAIEDYLKRGLDNDMCQSFQTADDCWALIERSPFGLGPSSWHSIEFDGKQLYTRNIFECIRLLLAHLPFQEHMEYEPVKLFDSEGKRIFNEISTGDWWWDTQVISVYDE
jgi:hypothetical protein